MKALELTSRPFSFFEMARLYLENYDHILIAVSPNSIMPKAEANYFSTIAKIFKEKINSDIPGSDVEDFILFENARSIHGEDAKAILADILEKKNAG